MSTGIQEEVIVGEDPTAEELELIQWAEEVRRKSVSVIHDSLRQMVTLNTALLAGSAALFVQTPASAGFKVISMLCLFVSLGWALYGSLPIESGIDPYCPDEIREARQRTCTDRMRWLKWSCLFLVLAFVWLLAGIVTQALPPG